MLRWTGGSTSRADESRWFGRQRILPPPSRDVERAPPDVSCPGRTNSNRQPATNLPNTKSSLNSSVDLQLLRVASKLSSSSSSTTTDKNDDAVRTHGVGGVRRDSRASLESQGVAAAAKRRRSSDAAEQQGFSHPRAECREGYSSEDRWGAAAPEIPPPFRPHSPPICDPDGFLCWKDSPQDAILMHMGDGQGCLSSPLHHARHDAYAAADDTAAEFGHWNRLAVAPNRVRPPCGDSDGPSWCFDSAVSQPLSVGWGGVDPPHPLPSPFLFPHLSSPLSSNTLWLLPSPPTSSVCFSAPLQQWHRDAADDGSCPCLFQTPPPMPISHSFPRVALRYHHVESVDSPDVFQGP